MSTAMDGFLGRVVLGRYRIVQRVAKGGMGVVYLARSEGAAGFAKPFIVKRIIPDKTDEETTRLFVREARITSSLDHPSIVDVIDFREEDGAHYMVLEYVRGVQLGLWRKFLRNKKKKVLPIHVAVHIVKEVLGALEYAHAAGVIHRDATPSNVLIDLEGHVKLTDFGIARMATRSTEFKTETPTVKGKFPYLSPELLKARPPSRQSDVYSCGVMLHELLTGRNEFRAEDIATTVERVLHHELTPITDARANVPEGLEEVVARATAKDPAKRHASAREMAAALEALVPGSARDGLKELANTSFFDPEFLAFGAPDLKALDEAWRQPLEVINPLVDDDESIDVSFTDPHVERKKSRARSWPWLAAGLAAAGLGVAALLLSGPRVVPASKVIVVRGDVEVPEEPERSTRSAPPAPPEPPPPVVQSPPPPRPRDQGPRSLTASFAKKRGAIARCLSDHQSSVPRNVQVSVRFRIDRRGRVTSASLTPSSLESTAFGECILEVARSTRFGAQPKPVSFRIPIAVK